MVRVPGVLKEGWVRAIFYFIFLILFSKISSWGRCQNHFILFGFIFFYMRVEQFLFFDSQVNRRERWYPFMIFSQSFSTWGRCNFYFFYSQINRCERWYQCVIYFLKFSTRGRCSFYISIFTKGRFFEGGLSLMNNNNYYHHILNIIILKKYC